MQEEALRQFKALRDKIEKQQPSLLEDVREKLFQEERQEISKASGDFVAIDRKKNMITVRKLLEIKDGSEQFKRELAKML